MNGVSSQPRCQPARSSTPSSRWAVSPQIRWSIDLERRPGVAGGVGDPRPVRRRSSRSRPGRSPPTRPRAGRRLRPGSRSRHQPITAVTSKPLTSTCAGGRQTEHLDARAVDAGLLRAPRAARCRRGRGPPGRPRRPGRRSGRRGSAWSRPVRRTRSPGPRHPRRSGSSTAAARAPTPGRSATDALTPVGSSSAASSGSSHGGRAHRSCTPRCCVARSRIWSAEVNAPACR